MKVYLDTCSIQRPLDTRSQIRITLEAEAVIGILALCEAGQVDLISSAALIFETRSTPDPVRREYGWMTLSKARYSIDLDDQIEQRARTLVALGIHPLDALHLASAEAAQAEYFCTCDDKLLAKARIVPDLRTKAVSPLELIEEVEK